MNWYLDGDIPSVSEWMGSGHIDSLKKSRREEQWWAAIFFLAGLHGDPLPVAEPGSTWDHGAYEAGEKILREYGGADDRSALTEYLSKRGFDPFEVMDSLEKRGLFRE